MGEDMVRQGLRRRSSMREVAELADVAISSVSRVLSGHEDVSPAMRARVLDAVARLDYEPDFLAQSLRRGQTLSIGCLLGDIANPVMADLMLGAEAGLRQAGYTVLLALNPGAEPAVDARLIRFLLSRRVDGIIVSTASEDDPGTLDALRHAQVPQVVVDRELPADIAAGAALSDHAAGVASAARHLVTPRPPADRIRERSGRHPAGPRPDRGTAVRRRRDARRRPCHRVRTDHGGPRPGSHARPARRPGAPDRGGRGRPQAPGGRPRCGPRTTALDPGGPLRGGVRRLPPRPPPLAAIACVHRDSVTLGAEAGRILRAMLGGSAPVTSVMPTGFDPRGSCGPPA